MTKALRRKMTGEIAARYRDVANCVLVDYRGLTADQAVQLRSDLRRSDVRMTVVKNSTAKHALAGAGIGALAESLRDMNAIVYGADAVVVAKALHEFRRKNENIPKVKGGVLEGKHVDAAQVEQISLLPGREQMLATFLATMNAPMSSFVRVLSEIPASFARVLAAVRDQKEKSG
ncbi:MAG: 50S ribosomal protein L10 [Planctomycetota bacterium]|jgi:large subunit ribosomal protein L10